MATKQDFSAPRKKALMTYGKATRKRQTNTVFAPAAFPPIPEDDSISKHKATVTRRRPSLLSSPLRDRPPISSSNLDGTTNAKANTSSQRDDVQGSDRKRKISQVYTSKGRAQESTQTSQSGVTSSRIPPRSRPSSSANVSQTVASTSRSRGRPSSSEAMDIDTVERKVSSPPLTPTLQRVSKQSSITSIKDSVSSTSNPTSTSKVKRNNTLQQIPLRFAREDTAKPKAAVSASNAADGETRPPLQSAPESVSKKRRKRLIDALVEQDKDEVLESVDEAFEIQADSSQPTLSHQLSDVSTVDSLPLPQTPDRKAGTSQVASIRTFARSSSALKFTYGQGRKVLEEEGDLLESLALPEMSLSLKGRRLELGSPKKTASAKGAIDDEDSMLNSSPNSKLRNIHELRQAGANSRVADTMQDLVDQIGSPGSKPSSARRAALLQVAEKIKDKTFMWQCRDHGVEAALLKDMGKESDTISAYLILSILVTILAKWPSSHMQQLIRLGDPANMFAQLLGVSRDIKFIVRDRKSNLSKRNQASLIAIQNTLRELSIWGDNSPSYVSPRSLVLKCLHLIVTKDVNAAKDRAVFSPVVTEALFTILSEASDGGTEHWNYPAATEAIDLALALSILDFHAVSIAESERVGADWSTRYLPIVADVFGASSRNMTPDSTAQDSESKLLEAAILKLTINLTNNSLEAPEIFVSKGLIPALAGSIASNFSRIWESVSRDTWAEGILDGLVLRLGILINFAEHSPLVRQVINDCHHDGQRPVDELVRLFLENYRRTAEADSMETSHLNVAFGYLTVLLGYLALHAPVRQNIRSNHSANSIGPLLDSLREFITHHRKVEQSAGEDDDGSRAHSSSERLEDLVRQLEDQAAYD
ncbi:hypothetical protein F5Y05DRAFT_383091 [Hypoxylon sp. FL0543]|nr:hypothetical protein F5Y05DRAFT_383091 [Hypoxylon sp. FL0543]